MNRDLHAFKWPNRAPASFMRLLSPQGWTRRTIKSYRLNEVILTKRKIKVDRKLHLLEVV